ncbi:hypothetical protein ACWKSP_13060 [Micromonosporaceae bacterium Da 78-11]
MPPRPVIALTGALVLLAGCSSAGDRAGAADAVALRLLTAVADQDGAAACATLAPDTEKDVAEDEPCATAILDEDLPRPGTIEQTSVYGQWAQVKLTDDTVFLAVFPGGWRVVAAGCTPQGDKPYDCTVQGG